MDARKRVSGPFACGYRLAVCAWIAALAAWAFPDELHAKNNAANEQYNNKNYDDALKAYDNLILEYPAENKLKMNKGSALYRLDKYEKAEEAYDQAKDIKDKKTLAALYYNLGDAQFMEGEKLSAQNNQQAMEKYKAALENYIKSLDVRSSDKDAKWNVQLVQKKIKQMENQQQQQNNKDNKQNKDNKDQKNNQNNQDKDKQDKQKDKNNEKQNQQNQNQQQNQNNDQEKQKPEPTPQQQKQEDMKKDEALRLIEQFSDDDKELNKKPEKAGIAGEKKVEKDW